MHVIVQPISVPVVTVTQVDDGVSIRVNLMTQLSQVTLSQILAALGSLPTTLPTQAGWMLNNGVPTKIVES